MKQAFTLLAALIFFLSSFSQGYNDASRSELDPAKYPFYHGVASGDPLTDRVILWTRITLDLVQSPVNVSWQVATDTTFNTIVSNGNATTDSTKDYTIKVDATGLQPNTWYYYRFAYNGTNSVIGRTKTLPTGTVTNLRFAVASCQDYQRGYYNAHNSIARRNDLDAVLFLGDYTYEKGADTIITGRVHEPPYKTISMLDYRMRASQYKLDPDLQESQRQYPWISVWDDHETVNNAYTDGAGSHNENTDGNWYDRKVAGVLTYELWMPIRMPDPADTFKIFRRFTFGDLVDLNIIDTRLYDRDKQAVGTLIPLTDSTLTDSTRTMVGDEQFDWLENNLSSSTATWQILGQQVIMAPLVVPFTPPVIINGDQWDGYPFERQRFYDYVLQNNIDNLVVLTGDIHTSWANDLPLPGYDSTHRENSLGVEFVATSITSNNELPNMVSEPLVYNLAQYVRYVNLYMHGYYVLDITPARTQADYVFMSTILNQTYTDSAGPSWYVNNGERFLRKANGASVAQGNYPTLAPNNYITGISKLQDNITTIMAYPNPFMNSVVIQYNTWKPEPITLEVWAVDGKLMIKNDLGVSLQGINHAQFDGSGLPSGNYRVVLKGKSSAKGEAMIKVN